MVRSDGGKRYDDFRERGAAGIGFPEIAEAARPGVDRKALVAKFIEARPGVKEQSALTAVSQVHRFVNDVVIGDRVVTYSPTNRKYALGSFTGQSEYHPTWTDQNMDISRTVDWLPTEVDRDRLTVPTRNTLGPTLTIFKLTGTASDELY
jgi:restriction system protein